MSREDEIIEVMARAMDNRNDLDVTFEMLCEAALEALEAAGYVVVPSDPTHPMVDAGARTSYWPWKTWKDMIAARDTPDHRRYPGFAAEHADKSSLLTAAQSDEVQG